MRYRIWLVVGAVLAVVGLVVAGVAILHGNFSPRGYIADNFRRSPQNDIGADALAYTTPLAPSQVADMITDAWEPAGQYTDGSGVYLRYDEDMVVIRPFGLGSLILVERLVTAYPRYADTIGGFWGRGVSVRGGGPGAGK